MKPAITQMFLFVRGSSKWSEWDNTGVRPWRWAILTSAYFSSKSVFSLAKGKKKKCVLFLAAKMWSSDPLVSCHQSLRNPTRFLTGISLKLKSMACISATLLLRCPVEALVVTFPFNGLVAPLSEQGHTHGRKDLNYLNVNSVRKAYKPQPNFPWQCQWTLVVPT